MVSHRYTKEYYKTLLPNILTLGRLILVPFILVFLTYAFQSTQKKYIVYSFLCFVIASGTDFLDGYLARKWKVVSNFGKFLDPIVDKILIIAVWIAFVEVEGVSSLVPLVILLREFAVTGMRMLAAQRGEVLSAGLFGKIKMVVQILVSCLFYHRLYPIFILPEGFYNLALILMLVITLASGIDYLWRGKKYFL